MPGGRSRRPAQLRRARFDHSYDDVSNHSMKAFPMKDWLLLHSIRIALSVVCAASLHHASVAVAHPGKMTLRAIAIEATPRMSSPATTPSATATRLVPQTALPSPTMPTATTSNATHTALSSPTVTLSPTAYAKELLTTTVIPTSVPSPSAIPTASAPGVPGQVAPLMVNLREGPGAQYPIRASYARGSAVMVLGRTQNGAWLRVVMADERAGWMATNCVALDTALDRLPVVDGTVGDTIEPSGAAQQPLEPAAAVPATSGVDADAPIFNISDGPKGVGLIIVSATDLHVAPGVRTEVVQRLEQDEQVKLLGQARGAWVRVQPFGAVVPGWVYAAHLLPMPGTIEGASLLGTTAAISTTPSVSATLQTPTVRPTASSRMVDAVPEAAIAETATPPARLPVEIAVTVVRSTTTSAPTPEVSLGVAGLHVALVTVFGDVLAETITPSNGRVRFDLDVAPDTALALQIAALGLRQPIASDQLATGHAELTVTLPDVTD